MGVPMASTFNAQTLPSDDNVNAYAFSIELTKPWFVKKGAMIAYYGNVQFQPLSQYASVHAYVAARFSSPIYAQDWVVAEGHGKTVVADRGFDVNSYSLDAGNLTIKAGNLMGFESTLELKQSIIPGFLTLIGTGRFLASSNGPVIFVEPPYRADPEALLGWSDCPSPSIHHDHNWMAASLAGMFQGFMGTQSGEERQYDFTGAGTVLMQSSEITREDPALLRTIESQTNLLSAPQAGSLGQRLVQRAQQAQAQ